MSTPVQNPGSQLNNMPVVNSRASHTYPMGYTHFDTQRFGEIKPFDFEHIVTDDNVQRFPSHDLRNYTLASPLMSTLRMHKDYYFVPMSAILPRTWEYILKNPSQGDDVNARECNTMLNISAVCRTFAEFIKTISGKITAGSIYMDYFLSMLVLYSFFFSVDSLFASLKEPLHKMFKIRYNKSKDSEEVIESYFDKFFSDIVPRVCRGVVYCKSATYSSEINGTQIVSFDLGTTPGIRSLIEFMIRYPDTLIYNDSDYSVLAFCDLSGFGPLDKVTFEYVGNIGMLDDSYINIDSVFAHKLVIAEYYTNGYVDSIYSKDLFLSYIDSIFLSLFNTDYPARFSYNGTEVFYDVFSGHHLNMLIEKLLSYSNYSDQTAPSRFIFPLFVALFGPDYSFKWVDYFTGAKPQPLAVGDSDYAVVGDKVNIVGLTDSILVTRFRHAVNRIGNKFDEYVKKIFGGSVSDEKHNVKYIANFQFVIGAQEVENTATEQGRVTTLLRSSQGTKGFDTFFNQHGILVGECWFDIERAYIDAVTRFAFHEDRFDMFNPYLQNLGDQRLYANERYLDSFSGNDSDANFGYTQRYMEYKQNFSHCSGAFALDDSQLDSWAMVVPSEKQKICSDFIRSHPSEFDRFYGSLTGIGAYYFHFIISHGNASGMARRIDNNPPLLF